MTANGALQLHDVSRIALVGDYFPRRCGIATFTSDLFAAITNRYPDAECTVVPVDDIDEGYDYPAEVRFQIVEQDLESYRRAASYINFNEVDVVCVQHEFGIYGGAAGRHLLTLLRDLRAPVVTTLHTVLSEPGADQRAAMDGLIQRSSRLIVMTERGKAILQNVYDVESDMIDVIPHGIPDVPFVDPSYHKDELGVAGNHVLLTFGLLSPNKGIEHALRAMPPILAKFPNTKYIVLGATHPALLRTEGESYRTSLERLTQELGIAGDVLFCNRFVEMDKLIEFISAADVYLTPYLNAAQITSGTLAYAFGCGKSVVSTPYWHAEELLADGRGVLVPFADSGAIAEAICGLLGDEQSRHAMRKRAYLLGREMIWSNVATLYMESFQRARGSVADNADMPVAHRTPAYQSLDLPRFRFDHLLRMTDSTGIFQHASFSVPNHEEGYCLDDNARALLLTVQLEELSEDSDEIRRAASAYAGFLNHSHNPDNGQWRNFMSFDRRWLEDAGSEDSLGRLIWSLGTCVGRSRRRDMQAWAMQWFEPAMRAVLDARSPRTWAFALLGVHEYLRVLSGDRLAEQVRESLAGRLVDQYHAHASPDWPWFEETATYANAVLPHALILNARGGADRDAVEVGLGALRWLCEVQKSPKGWFRPVGSNGFYRRGAEPSAFDQQPIEAHATVSACIEAHHATGQPYWLQEARLAFGWYLGWNDLGLPLYHARTGGCRDGLQEDRLNQNQGAESTLSFLMALAELKLLERNSQIALRRRDVAAARVR